MSNLFWNFERFIEAANVVDKIEVFPPFTGGVLDSEIDRDQEAIGIPIAGSHREFLRRFGSQQDGGLEGIDLEYGNRIAKRTPKFWEKGIPKSHILIFFEGTSCCSLNTAEPTGESEYRVYKFSWLQPAETLEPVAESYCHFFVQYFAQEVLMKEYIDSQLQPKERSGKKQKRRESS